MPYSHLPPETVRYIDNAVNSMTNFLIDMAQMLYIDGYMAGLPFPIPGVGANANLRLALNAAVDSVQGQWANVAEAGVSRRIDDYYTDPETVLRHPIESTRWGILYRARGWWNNLTTISTGLFDTTRNFIHAVQVPRLRQYWNMYYNGYISKSELLAFSGAHNMMHFYQVAGCDPAFAGPIIQRYRNDGMTDAQLIDFLGLDNMDQVYQVLGYEWRMAHEVRTLFASDGLNLTFAEAEEYTTAFLADVRAMEEPQAILLQELAATMTDMGLSDELDAEILAMLPGEMLIRASEMVIEDGQSAGTYCTNDIGPVITANAFTATAERKGKVADTIEENGINTNLIESQIALVMRQLNNDKGSVGSFYANKDSFTSLEVSFASPFDTDSKRGRVA